MPLLVLQWIGVALAALLGIKFTPQLFGIDLFAPVSVPVNTNPNNPAPNVIQPPAPSTAAILKDVASNPISILGVAAIVFGLAIVLKNIRGAALEAGSGVRSTYTEAKSNVDSASDPSSSRKRK